MKLGLRLCLALVLALSASVVAANDWTAVGATGTVYTGSLSYTSNLGPELFHDASGSLSTIYATFNVTNTTDDTPSWTTLTVHYYDGAPGASSGSVTVYLLRVTPSTGGTTTLCSLTSTDNTNSKTCTFSSSSFDFSQYAYYAAVLISRSSTSAFPRLRTLRID